MTYQPNIPLATDLISVSQGDIKNNFASINTAWNVDHVGFNILGAGDHKKVTLIAPIPDPNQITPIASLYTKASPTTITSDLYYQDGALASNVKQLTGGGITSAAWAFFTVAGNVVTLLASSNVTSVTNTGANGPVTINFTRNFTSVNYAALVNAIQTGAGDTQNRKINLTSQNVGSYVYNVTLTSSTAASELPVVSAVFFGVLA